MGFWNLLFCGTPRTPQQSRPAATAPAAIVTPVDPPPVSAGPPQIPPGWEKAPPAHFKFLSEFLNGRVFSGGGKSYWDQILGEASATTVQRLLAAGLIVSCPVSEKLERYFTAIELKSFLKARGLPVSGKKAACVARLIAADPAMMEAKAANITAYTCTPAGKVLAEQYVATEDEKLRIAHERSLRLLHEQNVRGALKVVFEYESQQVFQRGIGCDWARGPSDSDVARTIAVLNARPRLLKEMPEDQWRWAVYAAAMLEMWGERSAKKWLPPGFTGVARLHPETTVRMIAFAGMTAANLAQMRAGGMVKRVKIVGGDSSSCPACRAAANRSYRIDEAPELPREDCTSEMGCRCTYVADL